MMPVVGCYDLHLYCDDEVAHDAPGVYHTHFAEFVGKNEREARRRARGAGWVFKRDGAVLCPYCSTGRTPPEQDGDER
jgi:hypothetical protein